jgi:ell wall binding domain 2 (CWB2)
MARRAFQPKLIAALVVALALVGCGGTTTKLIQVPNPSSGVPSTTKQAGQKLGFPAVATKNTTRVAGADPIADAAGVALAVYPSSGAGTYPPVVALAPTDDWEAAIAASVLMAPPIRAPLLLSGPSSLPTATADALNTLSPTGSSSVAGAQVIRVGDVPKLSGLRTAAVGGGDPYTLAAAIDRFASAVSGKPSTSVVIASADQPSYAMPAAAWAAESGDPVLFVNSSGVPAATAQDLLAHQKPHIYVLGPPSVIPNSVLKALAKYGPVKRVGASDPSSNSVAFAEYRDPACVFKQPCAHVPGSFGWAMRSPGHGYILLNQSRTLDAAAAAPLASSGDYGPELLIDKASTMPSSVLNFFLDYATPGYTQEGPTAAVYNHVWVIGDASAVTVSVQALADRVVEPQPVASQQ